MNSDDRISWPIDPDELVGYIQETTDDKEARTLEAAGLEATDNGWQPDDPVGQPDDGIEIRKFRPIRNRLLRPRLATPRGAPHGRSAEDLVRVAESQVGFVEGRNNDSPYGRWYGLNHQPYCAMALSWCHAQVGQSDLVNFSTAKGYAYTPAGAGGFQKRGQWGKTPRRGAHVFFNFNGTRIHHVGIVLDWTAGYINTVEFNTSRGSGGSQRDGGGCWRRRRSAGIVGYGYPAYEGGGPAPTPPPSPGPPDDRSRPYPGYRGAYGGYNMREFRGKIDGNVAWIQRQINRHSPPARHIATDGDFGPLTDQRVREFQAAKFGQGGADGIVGPATWRELQK